MANKRPGVGAGWRVLFAFARSRPRTAQRHVNRRPANTMKTSQSLGLVLAGIGAAFTILGCQAPTPTSPSQSALELDRTARELAARAKPGSYFWIFIPLPSFDEGIRGFPAEVQLPPRLYGTNRIAVEVSGEVVAPGKIQPLAGSTVLQAVGMAGGFTPFAYTRKLELHEISGEPIQLHRCTAVVSPYMWRVYYQLGTDSYSDSRTDHVLADGDVIYVRRRTG